ncbi:MAG: hypothetical protein D4Q77_02680 [Methanothrix sp.]|nr:MAG: hypothetical protein D4Q77_02680 [Methanothrix sp.]
MKKLLLALALIVVAFAGCVEETPSADDLKNMMIDSVEKVKTSRSAMEMDQTMTLVNETGSTTFDVISRVEVFTNVTNRSVWMTMTTITSSGDGEENLSTEMETYLLGDTAYMRLGEDWTVLTGIPQEMWDQQDQLKNQIEIINLSEVEAVGSEKIDGQDTYGLKIVPNMETFSMVLVEEMGSMPLYGMNLTKLYEESEMDWTVWLSKETKLPLKNQMHIILTLTPETLGLPVEGAGFVEMIMDTEVTTFYYEYNQPMNIEPPEEARNVPPMPLFSGMVPPAR